MIDGLLGGSVVILVLVIAGLLIYILMDMKFRRDRPSTRQLRNSRNKKLAENRRNSHLLSQLSLMTDNGFNHSTRSSPTGSSVRKLRNYHAKGKSLDSNYSPGEFISNSIRQGLLIESSRQPSLINIQEK